VGWGHRLRGLLPAAVLGVMGAAIAAWATLRWPPFGALSRSLGGTWLAISQPVGAVFRVGDGLAGAETTLYPGLGLVGLSVLGGALRPRQAGPFLALGVGLVALGLGPAPWVGEASVTGPTTWLVALVPTLSRIMGWPRLGFVAPLPFAIAAAIGVSAAMARWGARLPRAGLALGLGALLLLDQATFPRNTVAAWPARMLDARQPAAVAALLADLPEGAVMHTPFDRPSPAVTCPLYGRHLLWSLQHGRPITQVEGPAGDGLHDSSRLAAWLAADARPGALPAASAGCRAADAAQLRQLGVVAVLHHGDDPRAPGAMGVLTHLLGQPTARRGEHALWAPAALAGEPAEGCEWPVLRFR
jgi:hypothetical protein